MAWYDQMLTPLRVLLNDIAGSTYTDATLLKLLVTAGQFVNEEAVLDISYTIDFTTPAITPDPSTDDRYNALVVMKAFCLTNQWLYKQKVLAEGIKSKCGPVTMEQGGAATVITTLLTEGPCKTYQQMLKYNNTGNISLFRGILSPFSHDDYEPYSLDGSRRIEI